MYLNCLSLDSTLICLVIKILLGTISDVHRNSMGMTTLSSAVRILVIVITENGLLLRAKRKKVARTKSDIRPRYSLYETYYYISFI